jgi:hypothetical protein
MDNHTTPYNQAEEPTEKSFNHCQQILFAMLCVILYVVNILIPIKYIFLIIADVSLITSDGGTDYGPLYRDVFLVVLIALGPIIGLLAPSIWDIIFVPVYYIILITFFPVIYFFCIRCC